jgi:hypothetical protein
MGSVEVVEVFPLLQSVVEQLGVVDHHTLEHPVELLGVDAMRAFDLTVEPRGRPPDIHVADPSIQNVVVELRTELGPVEFPTDVKSRWGL